MKKVLVWDLPSRIFHWSMVFIVISTIVTGEVGDSWIETHALLGYAIMALLIFRFGWGVVGGKYSRFVTYLHFPKRALDFLRGQETLSLGYSPLGAVALFCMFLLLWAQVLSGLFATDDLMFEGPLRHLVAGALSDKLTAFHKVGGPIIIGFLALHMLAIALYRVFFKDNRVWPMLKGYKEVPADTPDDISGTAGHPLLALVLLAIGAGIVWYIVTRL